MNTNDLALGFDPTGSSQITAAQLGQLVTSATPSNDRGFVLYSASKPDASDATGNPNWQRYIWVQQSGGQAVPYVWNSSASPDIDGQKWQTISQASIGTYQITGGINGNIALATITDDNITNNGISASKISGLSSTYLRKDAAFGGIVSGTYDNLAFTGTPVTTSVINAGAVTDAKIDSASSAANGISVSKLRGSGTAGQMLRTAATTYQMEFFTPSSIASDANVVNTTANRVPLATGSAWSMSNPQGNSLYGRLLQRVSSTFTTAVTASGTLTSGTGIPVANATGMTKINGDTSGFAFTPTTTGTKILIRITVPLFISAATNTTSLASIALYQAATNVTPVTVSATAALAGTAYQLSNGGGNTGNSYLPLTLEYEDTTTTGTRYYFLGFGKTSGTAYVNSIDGTNALLGTRISVVIEEYL